MLSFLKRHGLTAIFLLIIIALLILHQTKSASEKETERVLTVFSRNITQLTNVGWLGTTHIHSDIKMYINSEEYPIYNQNNIERNAFVHFHPGSYEEGVIHIHATGITLEQFLRTVGIIATPNCLNFSDTNQSFCNTNASTLKYFVNGEKMENAPYYEFQDLDKILITYGNDTNQQISTQISSVGNYSCIWSALCKAPSGITPD